MYINFVQKKNTVNDVYGVRCADGKGGGGRGGAVRGGGVRGGVRGGVKGGVRGRGVRGGE